MKIVVSGKAGVGKSTVIEIIQEALFKHDIPTECYEAGYGGTIKTPIEVNGTLEQRLEALQSQNRTPLVEIEERLVRSPLHRRDD